MNRGLFQGAGCLATRNRCAGKLRSVAVTCRKKHTSLVVTSQPASRHPDTATWNSVGFGSSFSNEMLNNGATRLVPTHDPASEIPLNAVRGEPGIDELAGLQERRPLMVYAAIEHAIRIVPAHNSF